ncbi:hypothetical protein Cgig2_013462 [Carnegiea gigantea]|uniref:Uncharacterized protein n=1 Tax=Carnegiea gigantea TaxID=171969 RepID=A0A9Q1K3A2_9CARY|nr:hypothetical protein Cgig2_013462 [Carnegiea gigantea]
MVPGARTPNNLRMKNEDVIVAWVDKTGGSHRPSLYPSLGDPVNGGGEFHGGSHGKARNGETEGETEREREDSSEKRPEISLKKVNTGDGDESITSKPSSFRVESSRHNSDFLIDGINNKQGDDDQHSKTIIVERPSSSHQNRAIESVGLNGGPKHVNKIISMPNGTQGELVVAGWPSWLSSVAAEAIQGWLPRRADSFEKLGKVSYFPSFLPLSLAQG